MRLFLAIVATALATPAACQSRAPVAVGSVSQSAAHCVLASWTLLPLSSKIAPFCDNAHFRCVKRRDYPRNIRLPVRLQDFCSHFVANGYKRNDNS